MYRVKLETGESIELGQNEVLEEDIRCPNCGGQLITNYGAGIECTFCRACDYSDYDYSDI
ncbi:hypothetical protein SDC9_52622 [bioreactor metagenome]|uniref:Uncharacterized protein n=1 Tax=bioreactor metagenome TaxID=1076179 RepID=A0A644WW87_9ZZZZ